MADILLFRNCVAEKENGVPTGEYTAGVVYYSTVTKIQTFTYPSNLPTCSSYSRSLTEKIDEYCDGDDKIEVYHAGFGQLRKERIVNGCEGEICNLFFEDVTLTNAESGIGGSINFTMNQPGIRYSLSDFAFGSPWNQTDTSDGSFSDLEPGSYLLTVQKLGNTTCEATHAFTITEATYSLKWWFEYYDLDEVLTRVEIEGKSFEGVASEIEYIAANPMIIDWKGKGQDKYRTISTSECRLNVIAKEDFEYISLFSSDEKAHRVNVLKDGVLFWRGYILPDIYNEPYIAPPYNMTVSAVDGLNSLKNYDYDKIEVYVSLLDALIYCLSKLELSLNIEESCFILPETVPSGSGLQKNLVKNEAFAGLNCADVLNRILFSQLSRISQQNGKWVIKPIDTLIGEHEVRVFNFGGTLLSTSTFDPVKQIGDIRIGEPFFRDRTQNMTVAPAFKELDLVYDYGLDDQIVKNSEFESVEHWGTALPSNLVVYRKDDGTYGNAYQFKGSVFTNRPSQIIELDPDNDKSKLDLTVEYRVVRGSDFEPAMIEFTFEQGVDITLTIKINGVYYSFNDYGMLGSHVNGTYLTAASNAQRFTTWLNSQSGISNYNVTNTNEKVKLIAKTNSVALDYGDVEIDGYAKITDRNNEVIAVSNKTVGLRVFAFDVYGQEKSLTTSGLWLDRSTRLPIYTEPIPQTVNMPVTKNGKWESYRVTTDSLPDHTETIKIEIIGYGEMNLYDNFGNIETQYRKISAVFLPSGTYAPKNQEVNIVNPSTDVTYTPTPYELNLGSVPIVQLPFRVSNAANIYNNALWYLSGGSYFQTVYFKNGTELEYLTDIIGKKIFSNSYLPTQIITGTLRGDFNLNNSFTDPNNPGKLFIINSMKYNDRKKESEVELIEMLTYEGSVIFNARLLETGYYRLLEDDTVRMLE